MRSRPELLGWALLLACSPQDQGGTSTTDATSGALTSSSSSGEPTPTTGEAAWASLDERPCPADSILSSENFGAPFMLTYCNGCHSKGLAADERADAPLGMNFDTLADVRTHAPRIWLRAADHNASMPPYGAPAQDERTRLGEWLACGAPTAAEL
ncbi:MAG: hypothetical protein JNK56_20700 [Myxococcales bacterium]|nr:hypothetical protein [Myxococcales bacterium]